MVQPQPTGELTPFTRSLLGATVTGLWQLAAVSDDGTIPLPGELALETDTGFVTLSCTQEGLSCREPVRRDEIRWDTEPDLAMDNLGDAEEWLGLVPLEDRANVPELPLFVAAVTGWFGVGSYRDAFALILTGRGRSLVVMTTSDFDLRCATRQEASQRAEQVAVNMNLRLIEREQRL
ncbi:hypothetical protein ALI22I_08120 [Saccharothrix sp. ALI-22-I]|uniref:hypothetical protein n=1 Tax=Saccharothrix sp. ALI-22-I TaxID=1933778 RepID=UPI00097BF6DF|nr:hypothetical protein [Saccharothrix sp. ALI-22-I]ONI91575.1 hypothetical protein ALI22I_08120 [Saccharothrix sp. ALI-22-I]